MSRYEVIEEGGGFTIAFTGRSEGFSEIHGNREDAKQALTAFVAWRDAAIFGARANSMASLTGGELYTNPQDDLVARMKTSSEE